MRGPNGSIPTPTTPAFDPAALLNPRAAVKRPREGTSGDRGVAEVENGKSQGQASMSSMIERMHNLGKREEQPRKRLKADSDQQEHKNKKTFEGGGNGTVLGAYIKEKREQGKVESGPPNAVVDLTAEEDDDVIMVRDTGDREVCLGRVDSANVLSYQIPAQKTGGFQGSATLWPPIKITLRRRPGSNNTLLITAADPTGKDFGKLDLRIASALAPLMDGVETNRIRIVARLEPRKKKAGQQPGQLISELIALNIVLYAPRKMAMGIGRFLSQRQVWLREPLNVERGIEYFNPQEAKTPRLPSVNTSASSGSNSGFVSRTVEEIRNDVMGMFDSLTRSEDLPEKEQDPRVVTRLLPHQKQALHFMTEREREHDIQSDDDDGKSLWRLKIGPNGKRSYYNVITGMESPTRPPPVLGGILADMMGLGKTLSILALVVGTLNEAAAWGNQPLSQAAKTTKLLRNSKATLLVSPVSTIANWEEQIKTHIKPDTVHYYIYHGSNRDQDINHLAHYDLVITTYSIVATEFDRNGKKPIEHTNWFRIVLDEAHMIRGQATRQSQAICSLSAQRRWAVTGTPVQNRLDDLGALIKFLRIKPFDEKGGFTQFILTPFKNADPEILPKLRLLVDSITLRRLKDRIDLPARHDQIVRLQFSDDERTLYDWFAKDSANRIKAVTRQKTSGLGGKAYVHILRAILRLRLICAHGSELLSDEDMKLTEGLSYSNAIDLGDEDDEDKPALSPKQAYDMFYLLRESDMDRCSVCNKKIAAKDGDDAVDRNGRDENTVGHMTPCYQIVCPGCFDQFKAQVLEKATSDNHVHCPLCEQYIRVSFFELKQDMIDEDEDARSRVRANPKLAKQLGRYSGPHTKTRALMESLRESERESNNHPDESPIKSVIFSGWTSHLDLIQLALEENNFRYTRLDGRMSRTQRTAALHTFATDPTVPIMLVSIAAGGLGLNLTSASKAYVMEPQFNPAAEAQAVDRVHRLGQSREVTVTRFIMGDSFEEKMLELQQKKRDLADLSMNRNVRLDKAEAAKRRLEELRSLFR